MMSEVVGSHVGKLFVRSVNTSHLVRDSSGKYPSVVPINTIPQGVVYMIK